MALGEIGTPKARAALTEIIERTDSATQKKESPR